MSHEGREYQVSRARRWGELQRRFCDKRFALVVRLPSASPACRPTDGRRTIPPRQKPATLSPGLPHPARTWAKRSCTCFSPSHDAHCPSVRAPSMLGQRCPDQSLIGIKGVRYSLSARALTGRAEGVVPAGTSRDDRAGNAPVIRSDRFGDAGVTRAIKISVGRPLSPQWIGVSATEMLQAVWGVAKSHLRGPHPQCPWTASASLRKLSALGAS